MQGMVTYIAHTLWTSPSFGRYMVTELGFARRCVRLLKIAMCSDNVFVRTINKHWRVSLCSDEKCKVDAIKIQYVKAP